MAFDELPLGEGGQITRGVVDEDAVTDVEQVDPAVEVASTDFGASVRALGDRANDTRSPTKEGQNLRRLAELDLPQTKSSIPTARHRGAIIEIGVAGARGVRPSRECGAVPRRSAKGGTEANRIGAMWVVQIGLESAIMEDMSDMNDLTDAQKHALKAFRKKLKTQQLEEDSRLGRAKTTGARNNIVAIQPPFGFPREVWQELIDKGYLQPDGGNFYKIVPGK